MNDLLPENEFSTFESRKYVNPQVGLDERNAFIDSLRNLQQTNNQQIISQTSNLGTSVPSNLGGLLGGTGYWTSRYQTPRTNELANNLRATAQAQALNEMMANEQAMWQKRYKDAYRQYQQRVYKNGNGNGNGDGDGNGNGNGNQSGWNGETTLNPTDPDDSKSTTPPNPEDYWVDANAQQTGVIPNGSIYDILAFYNNKYGIW